MKFSQNLLKLTEIVKENSSHLYSNEDNSCMWSNVYEPRREQDLVVNKKKVQEFKSWLCEEKNQFAVLEGPSGCGKFAMIKLNSKETQIKLFTEFNYYNNEDLKNLNSYKLKILDWIESSITFASCTEFNHRRSLLLFKNTKNYFESRRNLFIDILRGVRQTYKNVDNFKILFVLTNSLCFNKSTFLIDLPDVSRISLNPFPFTSMKKTLKRILNDCKIPLSLQLINNIVNDSNGDLRKAINLLEFNCKSKINSSINENFENLENNHTQEKLQLWHIIGRILYSKRTCQFVDNNLNKFLEPYGRKVLEYEPDLYIQDLALSDQFITSILYKNFINFSDNIKYLNYTSNVLSWVDNLAQNWDLMNIELYRLMIVTRAVSISNDGLHKKKYYQFQPANFKKINENQKYFSKKFSFFNCSCSAKFDYELNFQHVINKKNCQLFDYNVDYQTIGCNSNFVNFDFDDEDSNLNYYENEDNFVINQ
ncbi:Cell cycle checkpoint protein RAD17, partial [Intoshia linei]